MKPITPYLFMLIFFGLAACTATGQKPASNQEPAATASPTAAPTATPWKLVEPGITVRAADGLPLTGTFYAPAESPPPWPAVLLLHMIYGDSREWGDFPKQLNQAGYAVFSLDMRGHGKTGGEMDWELSEDDQQRVWKYLAGRPDVDETRSAVIGASMGANMALGLAANQPEIRAVGLLSPGLDYYRVTTADKIEAYGTRPVLIVASDEDAYTAESSRRLDELAKGETELVMYSGAGHGTAMFQAVPDLAMTITDWLDRNLKP